MYKPLIEGLKELSESSTNELLKEWIPAGALPDGLTSVCQCGHEHIVENHLIRNKINHNMAIIGSICIKRFERPEFEVALDLHRYASGKLKRIPKSVLLRAHTHWKIFTSSQVAFMLDNRGKYKGTEKQKAWRKILLKKLHKAMAVRGYEIKNLNKII